MALPAIALGAYKEKESILKTIAYVFVGIAVLYFLWKVFKAFQKVGDIGKAIREGVEEGIGELKEYGITKPVTPDDTAQVVTERASKNKNEPYLIPEPTYKALKELPENVKPYVPDYSKAEKKTSTIGSKLGLWTPQREKQIHKAVPRYIDEEEYKDIQAKRWEAIAKKYAEIAKKEKPTVPGYQNPVFERIRLVR